jgi:7-carboxy-7-deazaguanine synthase
VSYKVKELFFTLQGEGGQSGRAAVFCRFAGCNLWSGLERDRSHARCSFCDTDFRGLDGPGGGQFKSADHLSDAVGGTWGASDGPRYVVLTGGEPLLQVDEQLLEALHRRDFEVGLETNGSIPAPTGVDWICVSPKPGVELRQTSGAELKLVWPQPLDPAQYLHLQFQHFYLQPMAGPDLAASMRACVEYCLQNPVWRLSLQTHKVLGIP